jgi:L-lactate dehydrogenase complex protein LldE
VDQLFPEVGLATLEVLQALRVQPVLLDGVACCGQPLLSAGARGGAVPLVHAFTRAAARFDHIVCPSASCVATLRHGDALADNGSQSRGTVRELCEFLVDVMKVDEAPRAAHDELGSFPHRVALQGSCHGLRDLRLGGASERPGEPASKVRRLLERLADIHLVEPTRADECCGFGGIFSVTEPALSCLMGQDLIADYERAEAEIVTSADVSCLAHLAGLARRQGSRLRFMHVAEILAGARTRTTAAA